MEKDIRKSFVMNWNSILDGSLSNPDNPPLILRQSLVFEKSYLNQPDKLPLAAYYRQYRQPIFEIFDCIFFVNETHDKLTDRQGVGLSILYTECKNSLRRSDFTAVFLFIGGNFNEYDSKK